MNDMGNNIFEGPNVRVSESVDRFGDQFSPSIDDVNTRGNDDEGLIMVVGVGGGGDNAVNHMFRQGIKNVSFVVLNTDSQALKNSPVPKKVVIGDGLGAGNKPEKARDFAERDIARIEAMFDDNVKMVFITAGMGGGTGTGASPIVARVARERGILTIGIVTIPFGFEGPKKILKAYAGADELAKYVDALLVINNQRLTEIYGDLDFMNAFSKADDTLSTAARSISELISDDGYMNVDLNDVDTTLRDSGAAIISCGFGEGESRVSKAIEDALNSPLLRSRNVYGAKRLLFHIYYSRTAEEAFKMNEVDELTDFVSSLSPEVDVIWGLGFDETLGNQVKITVLAAGFDNAITDEDRAAIGVPQAPKRTVQTEPKSSVADNAWVRPDMNIRYVVLQPSQLDNDAVVEALESSPTYKREKRVAEQIKNAGGEPESPVAPQKGKGTVSFL